MKKEQLEAYAIAKLGLIKDPLFKILGVMKINDIYTQQVSTFMYKYDVNMLPINFISYFYKEFNHSCL